MGLDTTVVFTDLTGSTTAFESLGNAKATLAVTQLTRWICGEFTAQGGTIIKTLGDGVLAVFPTSLSATTAAVALQRSHQNNLLMLDESERLPIRVGIASGELQIIDGDCFGDAVNVASRLSDLAGPHEIWINRAQLDDTARTNGVRFRLLGPIQVRGRIEPCNVYLANWNDDEPTDFLTVHGALPEFLASGTHDALGLMLELSWRGHRSQFKSFELPIQIGRSSESSFLVDDPRVSRSHARVEWRNGSIVLIDLSSFGTWVRFGVGGSDLLLRREDCVLHGHGEIALGAPFSDSAVPRVAFSVS